MNDGEREYGEEDLTYDKKKKKWKLRSMITKFIEYHRGSRNV